MAVRDDARGRAPSSSDRTNTVVADGILIGTLVMRYSKSVFLPRYLAIAQRAALVTLFVMAVLIPASRYWAQHFAAPTVTLAKSMAGLQSAFRKTRILGPAAATGRARSPAR